MTVPEATPFRPRALGVLPGRMEGRAMSREAMTNGVQSMRQ